MTKAQFCKTYFPALALPGRDPMHQAAEKMELARAMFAVRGEFIAGLAPELADWLDATAAMTPTPGDHLASSPLTQAHGRYKAARAGWSLVFSALLAEKGVRV